MKEKELKADINNIAYLGLWDELLPLLRNSSDLVNSASMGKKFTALHQAAWHGCTLEVIGELLALGADRSLKTSGGKTASEIAREKHPARSDLQFILSPAPRTLSQMLRAMKAEGEITFSDYDSSWLLHDRLVECLGFDLCTPLGADVELRLSGAFQAVAGYIPQECPPISFAIPEGFHHEVDALSTMSRFVDLAKTYQDKAFSLPIGKGWATVGDLFFPDPEEWGLRGDPFLWREMAQTLCHVELPETSERLYRLLSACFTALTGEISGEREIFVVDRFKRGGMSSGGIASKHWDECLIPRLVQRADWLRASWSWQLQGS